MMTNNARAKLLLVAQNLQVIAETAHEFGAVTYEVYCEQVQLAAEAAMILEALPQPPEPDWSKAPEWARWATLAPTVDSGRIVYCWVWHSDQPRYSESGWKHDRPARRQLTLQSASIPPGIDPRTLKAKRPEARHDDDA